MKSANTYILVLSFVVGLLGMGLVWAQDVPDTLWTRTYGGIADEEAYSVLQTSGGDYLVAGYTESYGIGNGDVYLVKTAANGDTLWTRVYGGVNYEVAYDIQTTSDGGFIMVGGSGSFGATYYLDFYLVKIDSVGDTLWTRSYGGDQVDWALAVQQTSDGGYIVVGNTESYGPGSSNIYIIKTNPIGNLEWEYVYGDSGSEGAVAVHQTTDNGYVVAGYTSSISPGNYYYAYVLRLDSNGDSLWTRAYGGGFGDSAADMKPTNDGGYIIAGYTYSYGSGESDFYLLKIDAAGNPLWTRAFGTPYYDWSTSVIETADGGYMAVGKTESDYSDPGDCYIVRTDHDGDSLWTYVYGGYDADWANDVIQTEDYGYLVAGRTESFGAGNLDFYLLRLDSETLLRVLSPNGGEQWEVFDSATVQWIGLGLQGGVSIELNRDFPTGDWEVLVDNTGNDGEENVFASEPLSNFCRIRVGSLQATLTDESDANFSIAALHGGYLALMESTAPMSPVISWDAGKVECAQTRTETFRLKNFGGYPITVYAPEYLSTPEFSREIFCPPSFMLGPGQTALYHLQLTYAPTCVGTHYDTLLIQTDALNAQHGYARFPVTGNCIATPTAPLVTIATEGDNIRLTWDPVVESIYGCSVTVDAYLVFYSESDTLRYYYHGYTFDTTYVHLGVIRFSNDMFYQVVCYVGTLSRLDVLPENPSAVLINREEVCRLLREAP
jgi:hypothetical protein